jgi:hypothetical protein
MLGLHRDGDEKAVHALERELAKTQLPDGSFEQSPMKAAGVLNLLDDLRTTGSKELIEKAASYLISVLESQPGYERARNVKPGSLREKFDLCGLFGPESDRWRPDVLARNAREMNFYREYEPLLGPKSPVRGVRRSSLDRPGPGTCYTWGLIPLSYTIEALCRAGHAHDERLQPAINALLGAQRENGGWCACGEGQGGCTIHAIRALGSHPQLRESMHAERGLELLRQQGPPGRKGSHAFGVPQAVSSFNLPVARGIMRDGLTAVAQCQRKNGTFGTPRRIERVAAVLCVKSALEPLAAAEI